MTIHCFDLGLPPLIKKVQFKLSGFFLKDIAVFVGLAIYLFLISFLLYPGGQATKMKCT